VLLLLRLPLPLLLLQCGSRRRQNHGGVVVVMAQEAPNSRLQISLFTAASSSSSSSSSQPSSFRQDFCNLTTLQGVALNSNILLGEFIQFDFVHSGDVAKNENNENEQQQQVLNDMTLNADYPGLMARLMDEVCARAGCTWRNTYSISSAVLPPNRTYSDLLHWATETYDISVDWWMRSSERMANGAAFIEPWYGI
jgi:hypothetical protein